MMRRVVLVVLSVLLGSAIVLYFANPSGNPSYDPRARLLGFLMFRLPSRSMEPTIKANSLLFVGTWTYTRSTPIPGDVVVFKYPADPSVLYVKRVIAVAGSTVEIVDGRVVVDGQEVVEPYVAPDNSKSDYARQLPRQRVPDRMLFVVGDNRDNSADSRAWGFLPAGNVIGRVVLSGGGGT